MGIHIRAVEMKNIGYFEDCRLQSVLGGRDSEAVPSLAPLSGFYGATDMREVDLVFDIGRSKLCNLSSSEAMLAEQGYPPISESIMYFYLKKWGLHGQACVRITGELMLDGGLKGKSIYALPPYGTDVSVHIVDSLIGG
ncbi:hypothetical protein E4U57_007234 [Claviceps arundinis]|uniref:Uncharacterized protein n=1 Tax=Claviceps arundinis TaxID=1623583 RepID=A0ABQ7P170_9HYPO|nr:hypothetical protein E4U57_007234 [Claviceps arundinis]